MSLRIASELRQSHPPRLCTAWLGEWTGEPALQREADSSPFVDCGAEIEREMLAVESAGRINSDTPGDLGFLVASTIPSLLAREHCFLNVLWRERQACNYVAVIPLGPPVLRLGGDSWQGST